jgi:hypothetical protein
MTTTSRALGSRVGGAANAAGSIVRRSRCRASPDDFRWRIAREYAFFEEIHYHPRLTKKSFTMKLSHLLSFAIATVVACAPIAAQAKNDHHGGHHNGGHHNGGHHDGHHGHYYGHSYYPRIGLNFGYGYPYYGYGYGYGYGYPYYYHRPTIGLAFSSYGSPVYRGVPADGYYSNSLAVDVQRELRSRGYYRGAIDGDIGPGSRAAIRAYQADRGLSVTGRIDSRLLRSLGIG